jgi:hypothetical protein
MLALFRFSFVHLKSHFFDISPTNFVGMMLLILAPAVAFSPWLSPSAFVTDLF